MDGIINIYKTCGVTSHSTVSRLKKILGIKKAGHAGTLDPMATGVLPVLIGRATCAQDYIMGKSKCYRAGIRFGTETDSGDITGNIIKKEDFNKDKETVIDAAKSFCGKIKQTPPMYSAVKVGGRKLYELAREGKTAERKEREIEIYSIDFEKKLNDTDYVFVVMCSKGTYIRTLAEDIGKKLGTGACLFSLERISNGMFTADDSITLDELQEYADRNETDKISERIISCEKIFEKYPAVTLSAFYSKLCKNGCEIYASKAGIDIGIFDSCGFCRLYDQSNVFFALGKLSLYDSGHAVKAVLRFAD